MIGNQLRQSSEFRNHERTNAMLRNRQHRVMRGTTTPLMPLFIFGHIPTQRPLIRVDFQRTEVVVHAVKIAAGLRKRLFGKRMSAISATILREDSPNPIVENILRSPTWERRWTVILIFRRDCRISKSLALPRCS